MRHIDVTIVDVEERSRFWVYVCNLSNIACKAHATYYVDLSGLSVYTEFFHVIS